MFVKSLIFTNATHPKYQSQTLSNKNSQARFLQDFNKQTLKFNNKSCLRPREKSPQVEHSIWLEEIASRFVARQNLVELRVKNCNKFCLRPREKILKLISLRRFVRHNTNRRCLCKNLHSTMSHNCNHKIANVCKQENSQYKHAKNLSIINLSKP